MGKTVKAVLRLLLFERFPQVLIQAFICIASVCPYQNSLYIYSVADPVAVNTDLGPT